MFNIIERVRPDYAFNEFILGFDDGICSTPLMRVYARSKCEAKDEMIDKFISELGRV